MRRRLLSLILVGLFCLSILGTIGIAAERKGKLTIWAWDPNFNIPVMAEVKPGTKKLNPKVKLRLSRWPRLMWSKD